jgi:cytochrome oxidase Cu insertion factor (SCO1/SenC/PrrC family)
VLLVAAASFGTVPLLADAQAANYRLGRQYGGDFTLTDHEGRPFSLRDVRGKVVLLHFGFTACDYTCPVTMTKVTAALERLGARAALVQPLLVSIDARRDTPAVVRDYVRSFHSAYIGLTGSQRQVEAVARQYRVPVHVHGGGHAGVQVADHGSAVYLIARDGMLADIVFFQASADEIARRVNELLEE